jgi:hypothetical protein
VIEIVAFPSVQLLDVSGPLQVFSTANDIVRESGGAPPYAPPDSLTISFAVEKTCKGPETSSNCTDGKATISITRGAPGRDRGGFGMRPERAAPALACPLSSLARTEG